MEKLTLEQFITEFGAEEHKIKFEETGTIATRSFNSIEKTAAQYCEFTVEGKGKKRIITISERFTTVKERETKYSNCGGNGRSLVGNVNLKSITIDLIKEAKNDLPLISMTGLALKNGTLPRDLNDLRFNKNPELKKKLIEDIENICHGLGFNGEYIAEQILEDFVSTSTTSIISAHDKITNQMAKDGIITKYEQWRGKGVDKITPNGVISGKAKDLTIQDMRKIDKMRNKLMTRYGIKKQDLYKKNKREVIEYYKDLGSWLNSTMKIQYYYPVYALTFCVGDLDIQEYYEKVIEENELFYIGSSLIRNLEVNKYNDINTEHQCKLALKRGSKINQSDNSKIKLLKQEKRYALLYQALFRKFGLLEGKNFFEFKDIPEPTFNKKEKSDMKLITDLGEIEFLKSLAQ